MNRHSLLYLFLAASAGPLPCLGYINNLLHPIGGKALVNLADYDSSIRPPGLDEPDSPVNVTINFFVRSIEKIDHMENVYKMQVTFREEWVDTRLSYSASPPSVSTNDVQLFWQPDVFFSNDRTGHFHSIMKPNEFVRLYQDGHVLFSSRISLTLSCPMNLRAFPFDVQICELRMASYGYTTDDVILQWKNIENAVQVSKSLPIPGYVLHKYDLETCDSKTNTGEYSCLKANFIFHRNSFPYIIRIYIPLFLLVVASWTSFWLPAEAATQRLTIGTITSLTAALLIFREEEALRSPSLTHLDVWVAVSASFVFAAFFQYVLITYYEAKEKLALTVEPSNQEAPEGTSNPKKQRRVLGFNAPENVPIVDIVSRIAFPVSYLLLTGIQAIF